MSTSKHFDRIVYVIIILAVVLTLLFMNGEALGLKKTIREVKAPDYDSLLFDTSYVHRIDIVMPDWADFIKDCTDEKYRGCQVTIDGETIKNVGIRAKGNGSLFAVAMMNSDRFSFKLEFDHFLESQHYHGLDVLNLNNLVQDTTYMKDSLAYEMMEEMGVPSPLYSYVFLTVNGEDWGLYLAVEGIEDGFLARNYGEDIGVLYKPDSQGLRMGFIAGIIRMLPKEWMEQRDQVDPEEAAKFMEQFGLDDMANQVNMMDLAFLGVDRQDLRLTYNGNRPKDYENIFAEAKTRIGKPDMARLIASIKRLSEGTDLENTVNTDEVIRYFAVHNFLVNSDSYTGASIHNYYLYEKDGVLSMLPWDYNLGYGTFLITETNAVNDPIDTPLNVTGDGSRPMMDFILRDEAYKARYHDRIQEMLDTMDMDSFITDTYKQIRDYVKKDPTKFISYEEFEEGVEMLRLFCRLRRESVAGQLAGTIPSDHSGQLEKPETLIIPEGLTLHAMGDVTMGMGMENWEDWMGGSAAAVPEE